jgi:hypothetical protein
MGAVAIGQNAGITSQSFGAVSIGYFAGQSNQGTSAVAIGTSAGTNNQGNYAVAIGQQAGIGSQGSWAVSIGSNAGQTNQQSLAIAIGYQAGNSDQQTSAVAIGEDAGKISQGSAAIAIGYQTSLYNQGNNAIAIGNGAGQTNQGASAIAIGQSAGYSQQDANSIVINATSNLVNSAAADSTVIQPLRQDFTGSARLLFYNTGTGELTYSSVATSASNKTFVIDHPLDESKYLVHACLEGPEAGVYYRGRGQVKNGICTITLPNYVVKLATDFTVHVTPIRASIKGTRMYLEVSDIDEKGEFGVFGDDGDFSWVVYGSRSSIIVEPSKDDIEVLGDGPYKYYKTY